MRAALVIGAALVAGALALTYGSDRAASNGILPFLGLGFAVGVAHALDADHVAAVAAMMGRGNSRRGMIARGIAWGLGHTVALFVICCVVLLLGLTISGRTEAALEFAVGVMIAGLGLRVLWKLHRERIHIHAHEHDGSRHLHAHSHAGDPDRHEASVHEHTHSPRALLPVLGVGLVHGAAGSAGLLVLIVATADTTWHAMIAFAVFGIGSLLGMTLLTAAASYPLGYIHRGTAWMRTSLALSIGGLALVVGGGVMVESYQGLGTLAP